ncbi:hypothetical protein F3Y22_tig00110472pilonHSYRG00445 [Hibiscus syriacus]|uniref:Uncharacterized protein n=1 Tax=Hibiscus syriacus TaxID=106335 RepID=A0A6A3AHV1_HIBSY|nr:hypothetical protein F3Y22_tig00110472pilonHSYRG00445 [Hibiscus syriacus]
MATGTQKENGALGENSTSPGSRQRFSSHGLRSFCGQPHNNARRLNNKLTFAFVRYRNKDEALNVAAKGDGGLIDGFHIRVYEESENRKSPRPNPKAEKVKVWIKRSSMKDSRSFKEALIGDINPKGKECNNTDSLLKEVSVKIVESIPELSIDQEMQKANEICLLKGELEWRKRCLVGVIKSMYNPDIVQEALRSDGLEVKVASWQGLLVVLQYSNHADLA